jgi:hypothetical protein
MGEDLMGIVTACFMVFNVKYLVTDRQLKRVQPEQNKD